MTSFETETRREDDARRAARVESYMTSARAFAARIVAVGADTTDEAVSRIAASPDTDDFTGMIADGLIEMDRDERDGETVATLDPDFLMALWMVGVLACEPVYDAGWIAWDGLGEVSRA